MSLLSVGSALILSPEQQQFGSALSVHGADRPRRRGAEPRTASRRRLGTEKFLFRFLYLRKSERCAPNNWPHFSMPDSVVKWRFSTKMRLCMALSVILSKIADLV